MDAAAKTRQSKLTLGQRVRVSLGIAAYLSVLVYGVMLHTFDLPGKVTVPGYLVVWDMFCGWCSYERRVHFIAEGESGTFYDASEVPGHLITPHGPLPRRHFDFQGSYAGQLANSVLNRTSHEPILRIYAVEEHWPKRFNLPASMRRDPRGARKTSYWHTQAIYNGRGEPVDMRPTWFAMQRNKAVLDNPRLRAAANRRVSLVADAN